MKVSLINLARKLENDLIIYETKPGKYELGYKNKILHQPSNENEVVRLERKEDVESGEEDKHNTSSHHESFVY